MPTCTFYILKRFTVDSFAADMNVYVRRHKTATLGSNPQFYEHFSVNFARSAKIDNSSVKSGEQSDFSHEIIKSNV